MGPFKNIASMMVLASFITINHAFTSQDVKRMELKCIIKIGNYFQLPIPNELITMLVNYNLSEGAKLAVDEYLGRETCAHNAILYLKNNGFHDDYGYKYYLYFENYLTPKDGFMTPHQFCTQHYKGYSSEESSDYNSEALYVFQIDLFHDQRAKEEFERRCMSDLQGFSEVPREILIHAFYNCDKQYYLNNYTRNGYMNHIRDKVDLNAMYSPTEFCYYKVMEELSTRPDIVVNDDSE